MAIGTGHGATISFGGAAVLNARVIGGHTETSPQIDATHLGTTVTRAYIPADLGELSTFDVEILFDTELDPLTLNQSAALVVTFQLHAGETTPANLTGNGWITELEWPMHQTNEIQIMRYSVTWADAPTYTKAAIV